MENKIMDINIRRILGELEGKRHVCRRKFEPMKEEVYDFVIKYVRSKGPHMMSAKELYFYTQCELNQELQTTWRNSRTRERYEAVRNIFAIFNKHIPKEEAS